MSTLRRTLGLALGIAGSTSAAAAPDRFVPQGYVTVAPCVSGTRVQRDAAAGGWLGPFEGLCGDLEVGRSVHPAVRVGLRAGGADHDTLSWDDLFRASRSSSVRSVEGRVAFHPSIAPSRPLYVAAGVGPGWLASAYTGGLASEDGGSFKQVGVSLSGTLGAEARVGERAHLGGAVTGQQVAGGGARGQRALVSATLRWDLGLRRRTIDPELTRLTPLTHLTRVWVRPTEGVQNGGVFLQPDARLFLSVEGEIAHPSLGATGPAGHGTGDAPRTGQVFGEVDGERFAIGAGVCPPAGLEGPLRVSVHLPPDLRDGWTGRYRLVVYEREGEACPVAAE